MNVLIIEDERLAAERLESLIKQYDADINVVGFCDSVSASVKWFNSNPAPDLAFLDIQLADGLSFEIFEQTIVDCPVIFTTAFDEYAIKAFKVNSIDYLLKPIDLEELSAAIEKFKKTQRPEAVPQQHQVFDKVLQMLSHNYKKRFVIKVGEHIRSIPVENILYFYSYEKATFLHTSDNRNYVIDYPLEQLEDLVDPGLFFRVNRKYMIAMNSFDDIISYSNSRLKVELLHSDDQDVIVAREKVKEFKNWLDR
ncbi:MAG: response regulator transcription factor [Chlorobi bacterium]|nr:response regulator transcription factor [Chlorobiota bacterium]